MNRVALDRMRICYKEIKKQNDVIARLLPQAFPIGSKIYYHHGSTERAAIVMEHFAAFHRIKVKGTTGAEYWIDLKKLI